MPGTRSSAAARTGTASMLFQCQDNWCASLWTGRRKQRSASWRARPFSPKHERDLCLCCGAWLPCRGLEVPQPAHLPPCPKVRTPWQHRFLPEAFQELCGCQRCWPTFPFKKVVVVHPHQFHKVWVDLLEVAVHERNAKGQQAPQMTGQMSAEPRSIPRHRLHVAGRQGLPLRWSSVVSM